MKDGDGVYWMEPSAFTVAAPTDGAARDRDGQRVAIDVAIVRERFEASRQALHRPHGVRDAPAGGSFTGRTVMATVPVTDLRGPVREQ